VGNVLSLVYWSDVMNINDVFAGKYIKAGNLSGGEYHAVIESVSMEEVGKNEMKPVMRFRGWSQGFVLNKTNSKTITKIAGSGNTDDWIGLGITLYQSETEMAGDTVECIRVRLKPPTPEQIAESSPPASAQSPVAG